MSDIDSHLTHRASLSYQSACTSGVQSWSRPAVGFNCRSGAFLLPCHGDAESLLRFDEVIDLFGILGNGELNTLDRSRELIASRPVVR